MPGSKQITELTDQLFRQEAGKMVAILTRIFGIENLELSEDVVQETFLAAVKSWGLKGLPENPSAWLMTVAKNKAIDALRKNKFALPTDFSDPGRKLLLSEYTLAAQVDKLWQDNEIRDEQMRMMFACCHPGLSAENQISLILKTLCGFSTAEIARAFITSEDTISKRIYRSKEFFRQNKITPVFPMLQELPNRIDAVLKTIYLIFNNGYYSNLSEKLIRKDMVNQAIYLGQLLCDNALTALPRVYAAMALMCFHNSRIDSRITPAGNIILLEKQDRSRWHQQMIQQGKIFLEKAADGNELSSYHLEAAIAYEHCTASSFETTNWQQILSYYNLLMEHYPSPVGALSRVSVIYKLFGAKETLSTIEESPFINEWRKIPAYFTLLGELFSKSNKVKAFENFQHAITLTASDAEKKLLMSKIVALSN